MKRAAPVFGHAGAIAVLCIAMGCAPGGVSQGTILPQAGPRTPSTISCGPAADATRRSAGVRAISDCDDADPGAWLGGDGGTGDIGFYGDPGPYIDVTDPNGPPPSGPPSCVSNNNCDTACPGLVDACVSYGGPPGTGDAGGVGCPPAVSSVLRSSATTRGTLSCGSVAYVPPNSTAGLNFQVSHFWPRLSRNKSDRR